MLFHRPILKKTSRRARPVLRGTAWQPPDPRYPSAVFTLTASTVIRAPIKLLYDFHLNPHNARYILPRGQEIVELRVPEAIQPGSEIHLKVRHVGLSQDWIVFWEELVPPHGSPAEARIVDRARQSPFPSWRHTRVFRELENRVEMTEYIEYNLPFRPLHGLIQPFFHSHLRSLFAQRQRKTKILLEQVTLEQEMRNLGLPIPDP
jgi:ligand-binding SRPBCC domain-containing protein